MSARFIPFLAVVGLTVAPALARAQDPAASTLVIRVRSIDSLISDGKFLAALVGAEEQAKQFDGLIKSKIGAKGLDGIDPKRPIVVLGNLGNQPPLDTTALLMVPVADEKAVLDLLDSLNFKAEKGNDGIYTVRTGLPEAVYFRFANKYAYVTGRDKGPLAKAKLPEPASVLPASERAALTVMVRLDQIPDNLKQLVVQRIDLKLADIQDQLPGKTKIQKALHEQMVKEARQRLTSLVKDGQALTLRFDLDRKTNELVAEAALTGKARSKLAASIADFGSSKSLFGGALGADAALNGLLHLVLPEELRKALDPIIDETTRSALADIEDAGKRAVAEKLFKAMVPTLKMGELDTAVSVRGPGPNGHYATVLALKVKDGKGIEQAGRDIFPLAPEGDRAKIKLDAEEVGDVKIHRFDIQKEFDAKARALFGDNPLYMAFRSDAWFFAMGEGGLEALKETLTAKTKSGPQAQFEISLKRFAKAMAQDRENKDAEKFAAQAFGQGTDNDRVRVTLEGGDALRLRFTMKAPVVKFLALMGNKDKQ